MAESDKWVLAVAATASSTTVGHEEGLYGEPEGDEEAGPISSPPARPPGDPRAWAQEDVARLRQMVADGTMSVRNMADDLQTSRNAVIGKINRLGLSKPRPVRVGPPPKRIRTYRPKPRRSPMPVVLPPRQERVQEDYRGPVLCWELREDSCRWPLWRGNEPINEKYFCGETQTLGSSYCVQHYLKAHGQ